MTGHVISATAAARGHGGNTVCPPTGHHQRLRIRLVLLLGLICVLSTLFLLHQQTGLATGPNAAIEALLSGIPLGFESSKSRRAIERLEAELRDAKRQIEQLSGASKGEKSWHVTGTRADPWKKKNNERKPEAGAVPRAKENERKPGAGAVPLKKNGEWKPLLPVSAEGIPIAVNFSEWPIWKRPFEWPANVPNARVDKSAQQRRDMRIKNGTDIKQRPYEPSKPMNILLLYADDWRYDTLGVAGNPTVQTPAIDRLAREGVRFTHNCVTTSVCWVSRVSMYSSLYLARHNSTRPREFYVDWNETIYHLMQKNGYHVGHVGKWGVNHPHKHQPNFQVEEDGWHYDVRDGRIRQITEKNEEDALRFLGERPKDRPFFVNVAFFATHAVDGDKRQYLPQNKSMGLYVDDVIPMPPNNDTYNRLPHFFLTNNNEGRTRWQWRYDSYDKHQHMMKNYYRMASEVDSACASIIEEVRRQGELENTLIIFTTDNGNFHAEHGLADKWYPHQESIRVPLIIKDPRMSPEKLGTLNADFTLNIDLAPTMLAAAGIQAPRSMMGRDMAQLYLGSEKAQTPTVAKSRYLQGTDASKWRTEFFYEHPIISHKEYIPSSEALVRKDYKYFFWPDYKLEQLFHLKSDPREENDLIKNEAPAIQETLAEMRVRFNELKRVVHNQTLHVIM